MTALYELTIFLAIALIAIVATVFVLAVSLLGRAIEKASEEQEEEVKKQSSEFDETIAGLQKKLKEAKKPEAISSLRKEIDEYEKKKRKREKDLKSISQRYRLLTVKGTVLYPGLFFLFSLILAGAARYIVTVPLVFAANAVWGVALLTLAWGCYRIYQCLKVIEDVAITTEQAQLEKTIQAFESALERHEEARRPKLELKFKKREPPFSFKPDVEESIDFFISLKQGDVAKGAELLFFAPEGFEFPGSETWHQDSDYTIPNALTTKFDLGDLKRGMNYKRSLNIKTPLKIDEYSLGYSLRCEGFVSELMRLKVKIE